MQGNRQVFSATIVKLGINAYLNVPEKIVASLLAAAGKKNAPVQVKCILNGVDFDANVVRYSGDWRLYLNLVTRRAANCDIGDTVKIQLAYDPTLRMPPMPEPFRQALRGDPNLQKAWRLRLTPKRREILQALNDKRNDAQLAHGIAETMRTVPLSLIGHQLNPSNSQIPTQTPPTQATQCLGRLSGRSGARPFAKKKRVSQNFNQQERVFHGLYRSADHQFTLQANLMIALANSDNIDFVHKRKQLVNVVKMPQFRKRDLP